MVLIVTTVSLWRVLLYACTYCTVSTQTSCFVHLHKASIYLDASYIMTKNTAHQFSSTGKIPLPFPPPIYAGEIWWLVDRGGGCVFGTSPPAPVVWWFLTLFLGVWEPAYLWAAMSLFCHTSRGFWGPSAPCRGSGWSLQMGLLHMGQTLRISSHFTRHLSRRQGEKRRDGSVMHQLSIDSSAVMHYSHVTRWQAETAECFWEPKESDRCCSRQCLDSLICGSFILLFLY